WDGCFDTKSIIDNTSDKMDIVIYPATSQTDVTFGEEENTSRYVHYERSYYLYIFNAKFSILDINTGSSSYNKTSVALSGENGQTYEYYFVVGETMNSQSYVKDPMTKEQAILNAERNATNTNTTWNFMRITFTETMLDQIKKDINGEITKLEIKDAEGISQFSTDIHLDFSQSFFADMKVLFDNYNTYLDSYLAADGDKNKIKDAENTFHDFYDPWYEDFKAAKEQTGYTFRYEDSILSPSKLIWQTIGMLALYALVVALFFVLLFHFSVVRRIFSRETYKSYSKSSEVMVNGKLVKKSKGKPVKSSTNPQTEVLPDTAADDSLETVTAGEVLAEATNENVEEGVETPKMEEPEAIEVVNEEPTLNSVVEPTEESKVEATSAEVVVPEEKKEEPTKPAAKKPAAKKSTTATKKSTTSTAKKTSTKPKEQKNEEN
ncbi:hypothetical protein HDR67_03170, partial [bacterium]|nr:hypothetical protein [bacterium]